MIPSEGEALALHHKYGSTQILVGHCQAVAKVSMVLVSELERRGKTVDLGAVLAGALLHDIGRNRVQTVRHGLEGSKMIESEGVDTKVVEIVRKHVGAGISSNEAKTLGLPDLDYVPRTTEERIVCFADKMVDSASVRPFDAEVQRFAKKGHDVKRLLAIKKSLQEELGIDPEQLVLDRIKGSR